MKTTSLLSAIALLVVAVCSPASAAVMDFESLAFTGFSNQAPQTIPGPTPTEYTEDGFTLTSDGVNAGFGFARYGTASDRFPGSTALLNNTIGRDTILTKNGGGSFFISSIDLATTNIGTGTFDLLFTGTKSNASTVSQTFSIDNTTFSLETFQFSSNFTDLTSLKWTQSDPSHQFDNIVLDQTVSTVPIPASLPLLLSGLLGLGVIARRRKQ